MTEQLDPLPAGTAAPALMLPRTLHEGFALSDVRGSPLVLLFYPCDWEPVSTAQLELVQQHLDEVRQLGASLVGISVDCIWSHLAFAREHRVDFPLLADFCPKGEVAQAYHVYDELNGICRRAVFVIDSEGMIRWSRACSVNLNPGVHGLLTVLEELRAVAQHP